MNDVFWYFALYFVVSVQMIRNLTLSAQNVSNLVLDKGNFMIFSKEK